MSYAAEIPKPSVAKPEQQKGKTRAIKRAAPPPPAEPTPVSRSARISESLNSYLVKVEANRKIKMSVDQDIPTSGQLDVWIGQPQFEPKAGEGMNAASGVLYTNLPAASAKVTPSFPDDPSAFKVEPDTSKCMAVEPTGSTAQFTITPMRTGQFRIGASVDLYHNSGCTGDAATKTAEPITVVVSAYAPTAGLLEMGWSAFKDFFKEILAALVAVLILVFRKRLASLFGIKDST